jgi:hypothetical protein
MSVTTVKVKVDKEAYLQEILTDIERRRLEHKRTVYRVNDRISDEVAEYVQNYFSDKKEYYLDMKKCKRSKNVWDVIIIIV